MTYEDHLLNYEQAKAKGDDSKALFELDQAISVCRDIYALHTLAGLRSAMSERVAKPSFFMRLFPKGVKA